METHGNKTIMCSVLFLDIVEYSKKSVAGQISLKERFNKYLSAAISDVPVTDRIILDTGDGAAINFLGDVEDALKAALSLRESMLNEDPDLDPPLMVRVGINLGPVRLMRDINGQPNIVGDGINVAQRIMGFADVKQILVSRSYYDAVSRLSPQYAGMFHYQGSRTDKHVREHEVYAIGYPGDKTTETMAAFALAEEEARSSTQMLTRIKGVWNGAAAKLDDFIQAIVARFEQAEPKQRAFYAGAVLVPVILVAILALKLAHRDETTALSTVEPPQTASAVQPGSALASVAPVVSPSEGKAAESTAKPGITSKQDSKKIKDKQTKDKLPVTQPKSKASEPASKKSWFESAEQGANAYISVSCREGTLVFVDGSQKGKIGTGGVLTVAVAPGKHAVIASHTSGGIYKQDVAVDSGRTVRVKPNFCN